MKDFLLAHRSVNQQGWVSVHLTVNHFSSCSSSLMYHEECLKIRLQIFAFTGTRDLFAYTWD